MTAPIGYEPRELVEIMARAGIFCSQQTFTAIIIEAQRRAFAHRDLEPDQAIEHMRTEETK